MKEFQVIKENEKLRNEAEKCGKIISEWSRKYSCNSEKTKTNNGSSWGLSETPDLEWENFSSLNS